MKTLAAVLATAAILCGSAAAGVPDELADLFKANADQDVRITILEQKVAKLQRKKNHGPIKVCRVVAGQPLPEICR